MLKEKFHLLRYLSEGIKSDGTEIDNYRDISYKTGVTSTAEGSCELTLGKTKVLAGVKFELGTPFPDTPDQGNIMVNMELLAMSSKDYEPGPPNEKAIELSRVIDRGIRESGSIDLKALCVEEGEKVWNILIDICPINDNGNLMDAGSMAALLALKDAKFPEIVDGKVDYGNLTKKSLKLEHTPVAVTCYKIGEFIFVDPTVYEEQFYDARLTITSIETGQIVALQKGGEKPISISDVAEMTDLALKRSEEIRSIINKK